METYKSLAKILIIDDDIDCVNHYSDVLRSKGYDVFVTFSPKEALHVIRQQLINIVFIDCLMPVMDGYELSKQIYKEFPSVVSVILMSGVFKEHSIDLSQCPNMVSFVPKPIKEDALETALQKVCHKIFLSDLNQSLNSIVFNQDSNVQNAINYLKNHSDIKEGDILVLLFYFFLSEQKGCLQFSDSIQTLNISFMDGNIIDVQSNQMSQKLVEYCKKNSLLSPSEIQILTRVNSDQLEYLISHSLISPHQCQLFMIQFLTQSIEYFIKKTHINAQYTLLNEDALKDQKKANRFKGELQFSHLVQSLISMIHSQLSDTYLKSFFNSIEFLSLYKKEISPLMLEKNSFLQKMHLYYDLLLESSNLNTFWNQCSSKDILLIKKEIFILMLQRHLLVSATESRSILESFYLKRYELLQKHLHGLNIEQIFSFLGCDNLDDINKVKKIYRNFMKFNHIDRYINMSEKLLTVAKEVNQKIIYAYESLIDEKRLSEYRASLVSQNSKVFAQFEDTISMLVNYLYMKKFQNANECIHKIEKIAEKHSDVKSAVLLWKIIVEIKLSQFKISQARTSELSVILSNLSRESNSYDESVYQYVTGLLEYCKGDSEKSIECFQKSLNLDSQFRLCQIDMNQIQNSTIHRSTKKMISSFLHINKKKKSS